MICKDICGIYEITGINNRISYKIFHTEKDLKDYLLNDVPKFKFKNLCTLKISYDIIRTGCDNIEHKELEFKNEYTTKGKR